MEVQPLNAELQITLNLSLKTIDDSDSHYSNAFLSMISNDEGIFMVTKFF